MLNRQYSKMFLFCFLSAGLSACKLKRSEEPVVDAGTTDTSTDTGTGTSTGTGTGTGTDTGTGTETAALTVAELAGGSSITYYIQGQNGTHTSCHNIASGEFGTALNGGSYSKSLVLYSNTKFIYYINFYSNTECQYSGGTGIFSRASLK